MHQEIAAQVPQEAADPQARELPHERAARLLATWTRFQEAGELEAARRWVVALSDEDADLFLEAHGRRMREREAAGETA
jgi:hypothetical protein